MQAKRKIAKSGQRRLSKDAKSKQEHSALYRAQTSYFSDTFQRQFMRLV
jgi:hypothetical protein